jgi:hypothetical protein
MCGRGGEVGVKLLSAVNCRPLSEMMSRMSGDGKQHSLKLLPRTGALEVEGARNVELRKFTVKFNRKMAMVHMDMAAGLLLTSSKIK